jgi:hypothetical protein
MYMLPHCNDIIQGEYKSKGYVPYELEEQLFNKAQSTVDELNNQANANLLLLINPPTKI